ncbi:MAG: M1 family metallopeptidase [Planctomycetes bacterium]|nr:M1 family metallopeptidase [Planctomycetota bacterium]
MQLRNAPRLVPATRWGLSSLLLWALAGASALGQPGREPQGGQRERQCRVDYEISARLEDAGGRLEGRERVRWSNRSADHVDTVELHLYLNAFANTASTHLAASGGVLRGLRIEDGWGWMRLTAASRIEAGGAQDLFGTLSYASHPDGSSEDRTVAVLRLSRPVAPGEVLELDLAWESQLPRVRRRTGVKGDFMLVAQWFPKLGVYESGRGWNCKPFFTNTEFFSDYGTYRVTLDLPASYEGRVGGGGVQVQSLRRPDERLIVAFESPSPADKRTYDETARERVVHDFTWTADTDTLVVRETFRWSDWAEAYTDEVARVRAALGVEPTGRDVDVTLLIQPEHAEQAERHFRATSAALFFYGLWFGAYPYEHITVVDPAWGAGAAGGMEYPTLFTCGTSMFTRPDSGSPEGVTVHECGHQFWYGLVGNDEVEHSWLDEGFNSFTDSEVMQLVYGPSRASTRYASLPMPGAGFAGEPGGGALADALALRRLRLPLLGTVELLRDSGFVDWWQEQPYLAACAQISHPRMEDRVGYLRSPSSDAIDTPGWRYVDRESYRNNSYPRTATALRTLKGLVGEAAFLRGMRHFALSWRYAHPEPDDFFAAFQAGDGLDADLSWYFQQLFRSTDTANWSVWAENRKVDAPFGMFPGEDGRYELRERPRDGLLDRIGAASRPRDAQPDVPRDARTRDLAEVVVRRHAPIALPLAVRVTFDNGEVHEETWTREEQLERAWKRWEFEGRGRVVSAELDPGRLLPIDSDLSDNRWLERKPEWVGARYGERAFGQWVHRLAWYAGLGG